MNAKKFNVNKVGWRVNEWADSTGIGRALVYDMISEGRIKSIKLGGMRIIRADPEEFLKAAERGDAI